MSEASDTTITLDGQTYSWNSAASVSAMATTVPGGVPQAEYMYGCTATVVGMILAYYDINGYRGQDGKLYDFSALINGTPELNARGLDGDAFDMDAFDTVLGRAIASERHVKEFFHDEKEVPLEEQKYSFISGTNEIDTSHWDCIADYLGTNQYWRSNSDYMTTMYFASLADIMASDQTFTVGEDIGQPVTLDIKWADELYGLSLYVKSVGYTLDAKTSFTVQTDNNGGEFTFDDYKKLIDAGYVVQIGIEGHSMVGYGYDSATKEIILDDTYEHDKRMDWGGSYYYAGQDRKLQNVTVISFDTSGVPLKDDSDPDPDPPKPPTPEPDPVYPIPERKPELTKVESTVIKGKVYISATGKALTGIEVRVASSNVFSDDDIISIKDLLVYTATPETGAYYYQVRGLGTNNAKTEWSSVSNFSVIADASDIQKYSLPLTLNAAHSEEIGESDKFDYFKIDLASGFYGLTLNSYAKLKISLMTETKTIASVTTKAGIAILDPKLLETGTYYLKVEDLQGKTTKVAAYSVTVGGSPFPNADSSDNSPENCPALSLGESHSAWAGFGDDKNYARLNLDYSGSYTFALNATDAAPLKLSVFQNGKKLKSVSFRNGTGELSDLLIDKTKGECYVEIVASEAKKGIGSAYELTFSGREYSKIDNSDDLWSSSADLPQIAFGATASDWVGQGDLIDYKQIQIAGPGSYSVLLTSASNPVKLTLYQENNGKLKKITSSANGSIVNKLLDSADGRCFVAVEAKNWKKGKDSDYSIQLNGKIYSNGNSADDSIELVKQNALPVSSVGSEVLLLSDWVGYGDTVDYFAFKLNEASSVQLTLISASDKAMKLSLFDSAGKKVSLNSNGQTKKALDSDATYYAGVSLSNYKKTPDCNYTLGISAV